jgi:hypothetical protein
MSKPFFGELDDLEVRAGISCTTIGHDFKPGVVA